MEDRKSEVLDLMLWEMLEYKGMRYIWEWGKSIKQGLVRGARGHWKKHSDMRYWVKESGLEVVVNENSYEGDTQLRLREKPEYKGKELGGSDNDLENVEGQSKCHAMEYTEADLILAIERT
ncbi:unnamed protein product [Amaranthus hypochondriacus]